VSTLGIYKLWAKVILARFGVTSRLSKDELDYLYQTCAGEPALRATMEDILKLRR
jgi:hypothetical protein